MIYFYSLVNSKSVPPHYISGFIDGVNGLPGPTLRESSFKELESSIRDKESIGKEYILINLNYI